MKKNNILIDLQVLQTQTKFRGIGIYVKNFIDCLLECNKFNVDGFYINKKYDFNFKNNINIFKLDSNINDIYKNMNYDIIIFTSYMLFQWPFIDIINKKSLIIIYDIIPFIYQNLFLNEENKKQIYLEKIKNLKKCNKIIAISNTVKNDIIEKLNIENKYINVIYPCLDEKFINKNTNKKNEILAILSSSKHKNIDGLLEAFGILIKKNIENKLIIVCTGLKYIKNEINNKIINLKLQNHVTLLEYVSDEEIVNLYNNCIFSVFPSFYEGFGLPVIESMKCNCPVICSDISIMREVTDNNALFINPYDKYDIAEKIEFLINNDCERNKLALKSLNFCEKYCKKNMKINIEKYFIDLN